jgi:branched-chain amino acid aminotransferase
MAGAPAQYIWMNGEYVPWAEAKIHVNSPAVLTGANVFEGIRGYANPDEGQVYVFRLAEHMARLWQSMKIMRMSLTFSREEMATACTGVVAANGFREDVQIRPTVYFGEGPIYAYKPEKIATEAFVLTTRRRSTLGDEKGIACCVSAWRRISDNVMPPRVKAGANYHQGRLVSVQAAEDGYDGAILLNDRGKVSEGPGACLMLVRDGVPIMPPISADLLESITRSTLVELCAKEMGLAVVERDVDRTELYLADEVFFCGSAWEVTPITSVDRFPVGDGTIGPVTQRLRQLYHDAVRGRLPQYRRWLTSVY